MQHDARAARTHRMAEADAAAVDVETVERDGAARLNEAALAAKNLILQCGAGGVLCAVAGGDVAEFLVEGGCEFGEFGHVAVAAQAIVLRIDLASVVAQHLDLAEAALVLRGREAAVALERKGIHLLAADVKTIGEVLGGLAHVEADERVSEAAQDE